MTFDDDFVRIQFHGKVRNITCKSLGVAWPPPEVIEIHSFLFERESYSEITDEQREKMTHVARGALYVPPKIKR